tara:strand:- start:329 stop:499 length:171 start_codon:yes stop_codon:yes gene_type:complete
MKSIRVTEKEFHANSKYYIELDCQVIVIDDENGAEKFIIGSGNGFKIEVGDESEKH